MPRISFYLILLMVAVVAGGAIFLATWRIPAPTQHVEQLLPNERFPR